MSDQKDRLLPSGDGSKGRQYPCCSDYRCTRKQPMHLRRGGFAKRWYVVTDEKDLGGGIFEAKRRHELPQDEQDRLTGMADSHDWLTAVVETMGSREAILDALDLTITRVASS